MIIKDVVLKLEDHIKSIGGTIDESTAYMDNYCHKITFKINETQRLNFIKNYYITQMFLEENIGKYIV